MYPAPTRPRGKRNNEYFDIFLNHNLSVNLIAYKVIMEDRGNINSTAGKTVNQDCLNTRHAIIPAPVINNPIKETIRIFL